MDRVIAVEDAPRRVMCLRNDGYELDLAPHKVYRVLPDPSAERSGWLRIVDETGEDYLYPGTLFQPIEDAKLSGTRRDQMPEETRIAVCVCNDGYPAALELHRIYRMLSDAQAEGYGLVCVVDESGEGYLYPQEYFQPLEMIGAAPAAPG
jgi:hypothetical protein